MSTDTHATDPALARKAWASLENYHSGAYFAPEVQKNYEELGAHPRHSYFGGRAAPMGAVPAEVVIATFHNFCPDLVRQAVPAVWEAASPEDYLRARLDGMDAALRRVLGDRVDSPEMRRAAELARTAAEAACERVDGRPLFSAYAALPWPGEPHLVLWHAQTLLREFRGDGHIALLVAQGTSGLEALVAHAATGNIPVKFLTMSRAWPEEEWDAAAERLRDKGLVRKDELALTDKGAEHRAELEAATDRLSAAPYAALGDEGCEELVRLGGPLAKEVGEALLPWAKPKR
ncbi:SCO6745 family protein [Nocardiopsis suaedae]|uniref:SalK n=1 Tax=Nocardiopsis suaedae TaxID=3018444 RepID=A0ABT4TML8_9ACTN|nr:hypothetical protein [Nocardiopsis suaedae]MDA2805347.1 hypothetical protein [Nocardiopsis suaedae]